jgi:crotonobetainyl-CoA:carnitine CoA-transferase CaiB-like acyl-CoA transferase
VDVSLVESCFSLLEGTLPEYVNAGMIAKRMGNRYVRAAPSGVYPTRDGEWLAIGGNSQPIFRRLAAAMGRPEMADDPKFVTNQARTQNVVELDEAIETWTRTFDLAQALDVLAEAHVPAGPVMSVEDIAKDPQFLARGSVATVPDDDGTAVGTYGLVPRFQEHQTQLRHAGGRIDRDRQAVLQELGLLEKAES